MDERNKGGNHSPLFGSRWLDKTNEGAVIVLQRLYLKGQTDF